MQHGAYAHLPNGVTVTGWLTTEHSASSYGMPVFVACSELNGAAYRSRVIEPAEGARVSLDLDVNHIADDVGVTLLRLAANAGYAI